MSRKVSRTIGLAMLILAIAFIAYALRHPEGSFPWSNTVTWLIYAAYATVTLVLLLAPKKG